MTSTKNAPRDALTQTIHSDVLDQLMAAEAVALAGSEANRHLTPFEQERLNAAMAVVDRYGRHDQDGAFHAFKVGSLLTWANAHKAATGNKLTLTRALATVQKQLVELMNLGAADRVPLQFAPFEGSGYLSNGEWREPTIHWTTPGTRELVFITLPDEALNRIPGQREVIVLEYWPPTYELTVDPPEPGELPAAQLDRLTSEEIGNGTSHTVTVASRYLDPKKLGIEIVAEMTEADAMDAVEELRRALGVIRTHNAPALDDEETAPRVPAKRGQQVSAL